MQENFITKLIITAVELFFTFFSNEKLDKDVEKTIALYKGRGLKSRFQKIRFLDAPLIQVEKLTPKKGNILELGSGDGLFSNYLAVKSAQRKVVGFEINKERVKTSYVGLKKTSFAQADVLSKKFPKTDTVVCFHLFHHLPSPESQVQLLKKISDALKKNGKFIIVEVNPRFSYKFFLTWVTDHFLVPWIFEQRFYSPIYFRKPQSWISEFKKQGFTTKVYNAEKGKPFTHIIYVCTKK